MPVPCRMTVGALRRELDNFNENDVIYLNCIAASSKVIVELSVCDENTFDYTLLMTNENDLLGDKYLIKGDDLL